MKPENNDQLPADDVLPELSDYLKMQNEHYSAEELEKKFNELKNRNAHMEDKRDASLKTALPGNA